MAAAVATRSKLRRLHGWQVAQIKAIARIERAGRPLYPLHYIAAIYGVTRQRVAQIAQRRAGRHPWYTKSMR